MPTLLPRPTRRPALRIRRPLPYWLLAVALGVATAVLVGSLVSDAAAARSRWGSLRPTVVATHDVAGGEHLTAGDVAVRRLPAALVPPGALRSLPPGAVAAVDVHRGEAVLESRLVGPGSSAVAARLPPGTRGIAVPTGSGLPLEVGDRVDVLATFDGAVTEGHAPTFAVAKRAVVVHVGEDAVTIAVSEASAAKVAYALAAGAVTLVLSG
jgi:Flp pilus assembly protein CpaB